jgi:dTDP-glucose 4,6-dehydratase
VEDHSAALDAVVHQGQPGEVYNIGASNERNNLEITKKILTILGKPETLITHVADRLGHDRRYAIDSSKIQSQLGWKPTKNFDDGLGDTIQWYLNHPQWVENIRQREQALLAPV